MKFSLSLIFLWVSFLAFSQSNMDPYSCYSNKKGAKYGEKSALDNRSDTIDIESITLFIDVQNWSGRELIGKAILDLKALRNNVSSISLDLLRLNVDSVKQNGQNLSFSYDDTLLVIPFLSSLSLNATASVEVYYRGTPVQNAGDWGGFYWNNTYAFNIGVSFLEDPHNYGRVWFPCFDNFVERSLFEYYITTSANRKAFCGGLLEEEIDNLDGSKTWHWRISQEIPSYLASMSVSDYETVSSSYTSINNQVIPIQLAARAGDTTALKNSFVNLNNALECFETSYAPYAWDRVGYCLSSFNSGAMEHACNINYMRNAVTGSTANETLMAHELSHHWWGNLITCSKAEDMWLNEGWASYSEALFKEYVYGIEDYKLYSRQNHDQVLRLTHINDGAYYPVSGVPNEQTYSSTVYDKGADMAHTIRGILGDSVFFTCLNSFLLNYSFQDVSSNLFESHLSSCSGKDLSSFFNSWIFEKGFHHYSIGSINIIDDGTGAVVEGTIIEKLWENQTYTAYMPLPLSFFSENMERYDATVVAYGACSSFRLNLPFTPVFYAIDMEERIQDATVDNYQVISQTGLNDFGLARVSLDVSNISDSALVRAVHHYIQPDAFQNPIPGLHLSPNRYWSIGGVWKDDFSANATFNYNGSTSQNLGYLDNQFITNSEDSLVMLFKAKHEDDWSFVDSFEVFTQGNVFNKQGYIRVYNVKEGDYAMAIYDHSIPNDTSTFVPCEYTGVYTIERLKKLLKIYPVPANNYFNVDFLDENKDLLQLSVVNILGKEVFHYRVKPFENNVKVNTQNWSKGTYIIKLQRKDQIVYTEKIQVN